jgi:ubiquitin C-terminal hydrolase
MHEADPKYLLIFLLGKLHQELNKFNYLEQINIDLTQLEKDSFDENKAFQNFIKDYIKKTKSIISDTFYGTIRSTMKCNHCRKIKYTFQIFNLLIFQLKNVKEYNKKRSNNNYNYTLNIYDAFDFNKKEESLEIYCNNCKGLKAGTHQKNIYSLPRDMIIILNRGINNKDFNEEFILANELDLSIQNLIINNAINSKFYLQSVITLIGEINSNGYYITYCRNGPNEDFLCYNGTDVSKANIYEAMCSNISGEAYEKITPYILIYHHIN